MRELEDDVLIAFCVSAVTVSTKDLELPSSSFGAVGMLLAAWRAAIQHSVQNAPVSAMSLVG